MQITFNQVPVNARFTANGNAYLKQSTRTARLLSNGLVFYFAQGEICAVDQ